MSNPSDSDGDLEIITVVANAHKTLTAAQATVKQIGSGYEQLLEVPRQSSQKAFDCKQYTAVSQKLIEASLGGQQQLYETRPDSKLVIHKTAGTGDLGRSCPVDQHVEPILQDLAIDKENMAHVSACAFEGQHNLETDLHNLVLQPLQRRRRQRNTGAGSVAAAVSGSPGGAHHAQQQELSNKHCQQLQQNHHQQQQQQQQQHDLPMAIDPEVQKAAEVSKAKRRRRTPATNLTSALSSDDDGYHADQCFDPEYTASPPAPAARRRAAAAAAGGGGKAASSAGSGRGAGRVRLTAEERAAKKAEEKARKEAEKIAAKLAKQAEAAVAKAAKRFESFHMRKMTGSFQEYESVLVMDQATAGTAMGLAIAAELDRRRTMAWQVVHSLPLSSRWPGCCSFCFKRRKLSEADEHLLKTAVTSRLDDFVEDVVPSYIQLVFHEPGSFLSELQRDQLSGLFKSVQAAHPACTLGVVVLGLKPYVQRLDNQQMRQRVASHLNWRCVSSLLLGLHLSTPGLQLRLLGKQEEAATHVINTARVIGQQPYSLENQLEACGGAGPGAASKAAAANMTADLGPATRDFAVNTLGKMHGMGGNKAWAVAKAYPSFGALIAGFQRAAAAPGGTAPELLLADLVEPAEGKARPRRVGPAMSRRLHLLLTCDDPDAVVEGDGGGAGE